MTTEFICWLRVFTLPVNCFAIFRKGTRMLMEKALPDMLTLGMPARMNTPPTRARAT